MKRRRYQRAGIPEYWIVDPDARVVERWRPSDERPEVASEILEWRPVADAPPLLLDGGPRRAEAHFWLDGYNEALLSFFASRLR